MSAHLRKQPSPVLLFKRRMGISRSTPHTRRKRQYQQDAKDFLVRNPWCAWGLKQKPKQYIRATQVHHTRGRAGRLLLDQRFWLAMSDAPHTWIHNNIAQARELGLICPKGEWGKQP